MKSNKELNQEHAKQELMRVRPKQPEYRFEELEAVVRSWVQGRLKADEQT